MKNDDFGYIILRYFYAEGLQLGDRTISAFVFVITYYLNNE